MENTTMTFPDFDAIFDNFVQNLCPDQASMCQDLNLMRVADVLRTVPDHRIARFVLGGSVGRKTCISPGCLHDFNIFLFVNEKLQSFGHLLDRYKEALQACGQVVNGGIKNLRQTQNSLQFIIEGLHFEIMLATNFVPLRETSPPARHADKFAKLAELQRGGYFKFENGFRGMTEKLKYSLVESEVKFFQEQPAFVFKLIRICKFWKCTLHFRRHHPVLSWFIETIALHVAQQEMKKTSHTPSLLNGFRAFLEMITQYEEISVFFDHNAQEVKKAKWETPIVLDPLNQFLNLRLERDAAAQLTSFASETLCALDAMTKLDERKGQKNTRKTVTACSFLSNVFQPRRQRACNLLVARNFYSVKKCHVYLTLINHDKELKPCWSNATGQSAEVLEAIERLTKTFVVTPAIIFIMHHTKRALKDPKVAGPFLTQIRAKVFQHILDENDDGSDTHFQLHDPRSYAALVNREDYTFRLRYSLKMCRDPERRRQNIRDPITGELPRNNASLIIRYEFDGEGGDDGDDDAA